MISFLKSIAVAFSMYSKIPMPRFKWDSEDMKYHLIFFPWIGAVIGLLEYGWFKLYLHYDFSKALFCLVSLAVPLLVTGGFHLDGFMDTMDAVHSYQSKEKKLEILKDPHIGAFSVICVVVFFLLACGFVFEINKSSSVITLGISFVSARCLSGISALTFPKAKKDGMMATESRTSGKVLSLSILVLQLMAVAAGFVLITIKGSWCGVAVLLVQCTVFVYYRIMSARNFGGITGDVAGFFVCVSELASLIAVSVCEIAGV